MRRMLKATGAVAVGVVLLAGCSQSDLGTAGSTAGDAVQRATANGAGASAPKGTVDRVVPGVPGGRPDQANRADKVKVPLAGDALIRTADQVVEVAHDSDVAACANRAAQIATAAGGSVYADERTSGTKPSAALTLKVPGPALMRVMNDLAALGTELSRHSTSQDVTGEVADVNSRVTSAQASIDQWRSLLSQATKLGDIISLESQLSQREADLEALQAQQRSLASRTAMATLTVNLSKASPGTAAHTKNHDKAGFLGGLQRGWHAFTHVTSAVATAVGAALPFLGLGLLLVGAVLLVRRRVRHAVPPVIAPADPA